MDHCSSECRRDANAFFFCFCWKRTHQNAEIFRSSAYVIRGSKQRHMHFCIQKHRHTLVKSRDLSYTRGDKVEIMFWLSSTRYR